MRRIRYAPAPRTAPRCRRSYDAATLIYVDNDASVRRDSRRAQMSAYHDTTPRRRRSSACTPSVLFRPPLSDVRRSPLMSARHIAALPRPAIQHNALSIEYDARCHLRRVYMRRQNTMLSGAPCPARLFIREKRFATGAYSAAFDARDSVAALPRQMPPTPHARRRAPHSRRATPR